MAEFLAELRRRHIYRIGAGYVVVAWGIAQVIDFLSQVWALPDWIAQPVSLVLAIGLPVVLIAAWMIVGAANAGGTQTEIKKATTTDWALVSALVAVLAFMGYQQIASPKVVTADTRATEVAEDIVQDIADRVPNSIAVLPFDNVSPDPDDAYFAVGVHDEILNKLSKIRSLAVIARGSVMRYAGTDLPITQIAQELNVEMVMTGAVRYAGNQVRLTAELIDGMTNLPVWTTEDEGDLSDIFAIQSDIAMNIANSLQAQFSVEEQSNVEDLPTNSPQAYDSYLKALALARTEIFGGGNAPERQLILDYLDEALQLDPDFAEAYAWKARTYQVSRRFDPISEDAWPAFNSEMLMLAQENAEMALALNSELGLAHTSLSGVHYQNGRFEDASIEIEEALRVSPNDVGVLISYFYGSQMAFEPPDRRLSYLERAVSLDPLNAQSHAELANGLLIFGRYDEARVAYERCLELDPTDGGCLRSLAMTQFGSGDEAGSLETLRRFEVMSGGTDANIGALIFLTYGYGLLGQIDDAHRMFNALSDRSSEQYVDPIVWAWAYMGIGEYGDALQELNIAADSPSLIQNGAYVDRIARNLWRDPKLEEPEFTVVRSRLRGWDS